MTFPATHPVADIWPLLSDDELDAMAADIRARGQLLPIVRVDGLLLDGRNRWLACERAGVEPWVEDIETDDPDGMAWSLNEHRRHAPLGVRQLAAAKWASLRRGDNQHTQICGTSQTEAATKFGVGVRSVQSAKTVLDHGDPVIIGGVQSGDLAVSLAEKTVRHMQETGQTFTSVADLKQTMRKIWREDNPSPEKQPAAAPQPAQSHTSVDTFGVVRAVVRHATENPPVETAAVIDKWTRLNILDDLPPAIAYLTDLKAALDGEN